MPSCSSCGKSVSPQAKFCKHCGALNRQGQSSTASAAQSTACRSCQAPISPAARFCKSCGAVQGPQSNSSGVSTASHACPSCGAACGPKTRFCRGCGAKIAPSQSVSQTTSTSPSGASQSSPAASVAETGDYKLIVRPEWERQQRRDIARPLYVCVAEMAAPLSAVIEKLPVHRRGAIVALNRLDAVQKSVSQVLSTLDKPPFAVCMVGSPSTLPYGRVENFSAFIREGHSTVVFTDNFYGLRSAQLPDLEARQAGSVLGDYPVSRIPFDDSANILRLLTVEDDLEKGWDKGMAVVMEGPQGFFARNGKQVLEWCLPSYSRLKPVFVPPSTHAHVKAQLPSARRLYVLLHGDRNARDWVGHSANNIGYPSAISVGGTPVPSGATVLSQSCFGAYIEADEPAVSRSFLEAGASVFIGSTIIAWGASCAEVDGREVADWGTSGYASEQIAAVGYANLDAGLPLAQALFEAKRTIAEAALADPRLKHLPTQTHNTCLSFVAYGAPWARVRGASRMAKPTPIARPKIKKEYTPPPSALARYRRVRTEGSVAGQAARDRLQATVGQEVWQLLRDGREQISQLSTSAVQHVQDLLEPLGLKPNNLGWQRYRSGEAQFATLTVSGDDGLAVLTVNEAGDVVSTALKMSASGADMSRYYQADGIEETLHGTVVMRTTGRGSFYEQSRPVLQLSGDRWAMIELVGDTGFVSQKLAAQVGQVIRITGTWSAGTLREVSAPNLNPLEPETQFRSTTEATTQGDIDQKPQDPAVNELDSEASSEEEE